VGCNIKIDMKRYAGLAEREIDKNRTQNLLLLSFAASFLGNIRHTSQMWRKRVGVEPTIRPAKDRITGFEGRERHRTLFASAGSITWKGAIADLSLVGRSGQPNPHISSVVPPFS
jgi:hypothetical protein